MIVQSFGQLTSLVPPPPTWGSSGSSLNLYATSQAYADIYRTQPNVRICVDFLARNIAQLGLPVYRRVSDTDRERLANHDLAVWLSYPNPATTRYRLIEDLMTDLGIYFRAYWLKVRYQKPDGRGAIGLVRLPPDEISVEGSVIPTGFIWTVNGRPKKFEPSEIVHFSGYKLGISPLETLRRVLAEEAAAGNYRESFWQNSARLEGVVERPPTAPKWTQTQKDSWREQWQAFAASAKAGMTAVLEDGMTYRPTSFSAKDSEFTAGGQLRREVVAAAYHIPQPLVGILTHATFSNIRAQHEHLYQDCLGPWNEMITQEIERQLLIECDDQTRVYIEFNIDAKMAGTPQDRASSLQMAVGRPWRTVNEARSLENLPRLADPALDTVAPQQGGPAAGPGATPPPADPAVAVDTTPVIQAARARQDARLQKFSASERPAAFFADIDRWNRELTEDLTPLVGAELAASQALQANVATLTELAGEP